MRAKYLIIGVLVGVLLISAAMVLAGSGDPLSGPGDATSQMYTLEQVYDRLATGAVSAKMTAFTEPSAGPGATGHTLDDIMGLAPEVDDTDGATAADVASGKTFWGLTTGGWGLQSGTLPSTGAVTTTLVPKTGQTEPYTTGDDGDLEMGATWPVPRFITGTTGVVTDTLTGLIWLRNAHCAANSRDWSTALQTDISQLNTLGTMNGNDCGDTSNGGSHQTDWRLPNLRELQSLIHYGVANPALPDTAGTGKYSDGDPFTNVQGFRYWTSTTRFSHTAWAWYVDMVNGEVGFNPKQDGSGDWCNVWPVRGGQ